MQQTTKYKLNLIETSDAFSPDALNQNTQKVEAALSAHEAAVEEATGALDQRIQVFEAKKFAYGSYKASTDSDNIVTLGFTPYAVLTHYIGGSTGFTALALTGQNGNGLKIVENGFQTDVGSGYNIRSGFYTYIALG